MGSIGVHTPPYTAYLPSLLTASVPENDDEVLRTVTPGRSNETQARLSLDPSLVTCPSTEASGPPGAQAPKGPARPWGASRSRIGPRGTMRVGLIMGWLR